KPLNNVFAAILVDKGSGGRVQKCYTAEALADMARVLVGRPPHTDDAPLVRVARLVGDRASERDRKDAQEIVDKVDGQAAGWAEARAEGYRRAPKVGDPSPPSIVDRLEDAAARGDAKTVKKLLKENPDLDEEGCFDGNRPGEPLFQAVRNGHL